MQKGSGYKGTIFPGGPSGSGWAFWASVVGCESSQLLQGKPPGKCLNWVMSLKTLTFKNYKNTVKWNPKVNTSPSLLSQTRHFLPFFLMLWPSMWYRAQQQWPQDGTREAPGPVWLGCPSLGFSCSASRQSHAVSTTNSRLDEGWALAGSLCYMRGLVLESSWRLPLESRTGRN